MPGQTAWRRASSFSFIMIENYVLRVGKREKNRLQHYYLNGMVESDRSGDLWLHEMRTSREPFAAKR